MDYRVIRGYIGAMYGLYRYVGLYSIGLYAGYNVLVIGYILWLYRDHEKNKLLFRVFDLSKTRRFRVWGLRVSGFRV